GLHNASAYIGMMLRHKLGIVILGNRAKQYPNEVGRRILLELAASRRLRASHAGGRVARPNQAGGGGPSYSRARPFDLAPLSQAGGAGLAPSPSPPTSAAATPLCGAISRRAFRRRGQAASGTVVATARTRQGYGVSW